jgi:predicted acetyltransferase
VTKHLDMPVEVASASPGDARVIESLLHDHLRELSNHLNVAGGAEATDYPYLKRYWSDAGRHAFLVQAGGRTVGFALVRGPASTGSAVHHFAEFYVQPSSRRRGIGRSAVFAIWKRFPGPWELQVHASNGPAVRFWASCAETVAKETPLVSEVSARDGSRLQLNFRV